jgi:hypothetical protein
MQEIADNVLGDLANGLDGQVAVVSVGANGQEALERGNAAEVLQDKHHPLVALVGKGSGSQQYVQFFDFAPGAQLHADLAPNALLASKGFVDRSSNRATPAKRSVSATGRNVSRMQAVENIPPR